jgi:hypothetical protein
VDVNRPPDATIPPFLVGLLLLVAVVFAVAFVVAAQIVQTP